MKRIVVIGCPGSGKSTFSIALHEKTGIDLYHLDMMYWNADKTTVTTSVFIERLSEVINKEKWIIDGNYASTMDIRISACDTVVFLDYPTDVCLEGIRSRRGKSRTDMPWIETEDDLEFIEYIQSFNERQRPLILELLAQNKHKNITVFTSREQADVFLSGMNLQ